MKLSEFAKKKNISYRTAWNWWKKGYLIGFTHPSGAIVIDEEETEKELQKRSRDNENE